MPDDLLRYVVGPQPYSSWWLWLAIVLSVALVSWYAAVFLLTRPGRGAWEVPLLGAARERRLRQRSAKAVRRIAERYRAGDLAAAPAGTAASRELRRFLHLATGVPAEYLQVSDLADSEIAPAAPVLEQFVDIQFNSATEVDVDRVLRDAEELILSWT